MAYGTLPWKPNIQIAFNMNGGEQAVRQCYLYPQIPHLDIDARKHGKIHTVEIHEFHLACPPLRYQAILKRLLVICLMKDL